MLSRIPAYTIQTPYITNEPDAYGKNIYKVLKKIIEQRKEDVI